MESQIAELPSYTIRVSQRARRISLRFTLENGLELIIPSMRHERKAIEFLQSQHAWIKKKQAQFLHVGARRDCSLPEKLVLPAIDQAWHVIYNESAYTAATVLDQAKTVLIRAPLKGFALSRDLLLSFIKEQAVLHLKPRLDELSRLCQLDYQSVNFGSHKTQWGSCSRSAKINLNIQLLFLSRDLLDYVIVHELCHTKHFNHSKRFWSLVEEFMPNYHEQRRRLRLGKNEVPAWVLYNGG